MSRGAYDRICDVRAHFARPRITDFDVVNLPLFVPGDFHDVGIKLDLGTEVVFGSEVVPVRQELWLQDVTFWPVRVEVGGQAVEVRLDV